MIKIIGGKEAIATGIAELIIDLDKRNLKHIFDEANIPFPEEKRRNSLAGNTLIVAFINDRVAGYLSYCRNWDNKAEIYISSLQIEPAYRGSSILLKLLLATKEVLINEEFTKIVAAVQKNNLPAIKLYEKLGFSFSNNPNNEQSYSVSAGRDILTSNKILSLFDKWQRHTSK